MSALFYFLVWAAVIFVMLRFGGGSHIMGQSHGSSRDGGNQREPQGAEGLRWIPPKTDLDPVCSKTVHTSIAKPSVHDGSVYYFCSRECREIFEAAPQLYVGAAASTPQPQLENRHV
tara:strand:- start:3000 stop:3350 length:351 start_codon:yes stop_codon:yes gene_type:complete